MTPLLYEELWSWLCLPSFSPHTAHFPQCTNIYFVNFMFILEVLFLYWLALFSRSITFFFHIISKITVCFLKASVLVTSLFDITEFINLNNYIVWIDFSVVFQQCASPVLANLRLSFCHLCIGITACLGIKLFTAF